MKLTKGSSIKLSKDDDNLSEVTIGCSWGENGHSIDVDAMVFFLNDNSAQKRLVDVVYYGNREMVKSYVKHYGDDTSGSNKQHESDNEVIFLDLEKTPIDVTSIAVVLNAYTGEKLSRVPNLKCRVYSGKPGEVQDVLGTFDISEQGKLNTTSVVVGYFEKDESAEWYFRASGESLQAHRIDQLKDSFSKPRTIEAQYNEAVTSQPIKHDGSIIGFIKGLFS
jgi:tellurium resistance protein TerZ